MINTVRAPAFHNTTEENFVGNQIEQTQRKEIGMAHFETVKLVYVVIISYGLDEFVNVVRASLLKGKASIRLFVLYNT